MNTCPGDNLLELSQPEVQGSTIARGCPVCGAEYRARISRLKHGRETTCGRQCSYILRAQQKDKTSVVGCTVCDRPVKRHRYQIQDNERGYVCSDECKSILFSTSGAYKRREPKTCPVCGDTFRSRALKYCSRRCFEVAHKANMRGEKNPAYVDGRSYVETYRQGKEWRRIAKEVYKRDGYKCQICGVKCMGKSIATKDTTSQIIQCHHIRPYKQSENNHPSNLATVCLSCHTGLHKGTIKHEFAAYL